MNSVFVLFGLESWKHVLGGLLLPPIPWLVLVLIGAWLLARRHRGGAAAIMLGVALLWLSACPGTGHWLSATLLKPPAALGAERLAALSGLAQGGTRAAIAVLGGGSENFAPEYGTSNLNAASAERLRYGVWLARATGLPLGFTGGVGWGQDGTQTEAEVAQRIAETEFGLKLQWAETQSRDTRENAVRSVALLRTAGVQHLLIVTHDWHMPRALRAFKLAAGTDMVIEAAPMALADSYRWPQRAWLPSTAGIMQVRHVLHELLGLLAGA